MGEPVRPEDLWWHLGMGRWILARHTIPTVDSFSFTRPGAPYFDQPWLSQIFLFAVHRLGGLAGLLDFDFVCMLAAEALIIQSSVRRGARWVSALLIQFALTTLAARGWSLRPQALAVPLFAGFVYVLTQWRENSSESGVIDAPPDRHRVWPLVPMMVLWANIHGSFPLGIALVLLTLCAKAVDSRGGIANVAWRGIPLAAIGCLLAPLANPRGPAIIGYVASLVRNPTVRVAREWQAVTPADAEGAYILSVLVLTALIAVWKRPRAGDLVLLLPFVLLELGAVRNGIWLSFVLGPLLSGWLARRPGLPRTDGPWPPLALGAAIIPFLLAVPWLKPHFGPRRFRALALEERTPIAAVEALATDEHRAARLLHGIAFGSYLIWALPSQPVFVDPRLEFYSTAQWRDLDTLERGEDIDAIVARYGGDGFLCAKQREARLVAALMHRPDYQMRYEDPNFAYFVKQ